MKRGQITIFIIMGLVIMLAVSYFIFIREKSIIQLEQINPELLPVQSFIETCIINTGKEGLTTLGLNGGYIYFPPYIEENPDSYISRSPTPELKNPYWWFDGISRVPTKEFMQDQISRYVTENLPECLNSFDVFSNKYEVIEHGDMGTITEIGNSMESLVKIETMYPLEIKDKFNKTLAEIDRFRVEVPVRLNAAHTLARRIMESENAGGFMEKKVIDLIAMDDDIPDTGGPKFQCNKLQWQVEPIKNKLKMLMTENFPYIKIRGSNFTPDRYVPLPDIAPWASLPETYNASYYWHHYIWEVGDEDYSNMKVGFTYDNYELEWLNDFYIRPNNYPIIESNSQRGNQMLSFFCMHIWHFTYDVKFPVKVTIVDQDTRKNDEFSFIFAFQGSIDHNEPRRDTFAITDYQTSNIIRDDEFCSSELDNTMRFYAIENTTTGYELKGVNLSFVCGRYECPLGLTTPDYSMYGTPYWQGVMPRCTLGILRAKKEGYADSQRFISSETEGAFYIYMRPVKEINYSVVKHEYMGSGIPNAPAQKLKDDESAIVIIKKPGFEETATYRTDQKIELLDRDDYDYDVEVYIMTNESMIGGYKGKWHASEIEMENAKEVVFHAVYKPFSDDTEMMMFFAGLPSYSNREPEFR
ncbi:MAG: hypothetical protein ABIC04_03420 [Nanoarchaeota archaeon]